LCVDVHGLSRRHVTMRCMTHDVVVAFSGCHTRLCRFLASDAVACVYDWVLSSGGSNGRGVDKFLLCTAVSVRVCSVYVLHTAAIMVRSGTARHTAVEEGDDIGGSIFALGLMRRALLLRQRCSCPLFVWKPLPDHCAASRNQWPGCACHGGCRLKWWRPWSADVSWGWGGGGGGGINFEMRFLWCQ
jgi:hypothetical protein